MEEKTDKKKDLVVKQKLFMFDNVLDIKSNIDHVMVVLNGVTTNLKFKDLFFGNVSIKKNNIKGYCVLFESSIDVYDGNTYIINDSGIRLSLYDGINNIMIKEIKSPQIIDFDKNIQYQEFVDKINLIRAVQQDVSKFEIDELKGEKASSTDVTNMINENENIETFDTMKKDTEENNEEEIPALDTEENNEEEMPALDEIENEDEMPALDFDNEKKETKLRGKIPINQ